MDAIVDEILKILKLLPLWLWILIPTIVFMLFTFRITRDRRLTLLITAMAAGFILITAGFQMWEVYLSNRFVGEFDDYGIPVGISANGWLMLIDAWPLWSFPALIALLLGLVIAGGYAHLKRPPRSPSKVKNKVPEDTVQSLSASEQTNSLAVAKQLEIQRLRIELEQARKKIETLTTTSAGDATKTAPAPIPQNTADSQRLIAENNELKQQVSILNTDLGYAKKLIEELLADHYRTKEK